jgi:hypothetical protein
MFFSEDRVASSNKEDRETMNRSTETTTKFRLSYSTDDDGTVSQSRFGTSIGGLFRPFSFFAMPG